jgi:hypothetical protein
MKFSLLLLVTVVTLILIARAHEAIAAEKDTTEPAATGTIIGKVVDADGKPAANCTVTVAQNATKMRDPYRATTDSEGKFKIEKVAVGDYNLNVRSEDTKGRAIKSLTVSEGKTADTGTLKLKAKGK